MKNLVILVPNLYDQGALVDVEIYPDERTFLRQKNESPVKAITRVKMLIDTGSNISGLDRQVIQELQLPSYSEKAFVNGAGGLTTVSMHRCVIYMDIFQTKALPLDILEGDFEESAYQGIIGRDVLRHCHMHYDGPANCFRISAPDF
jgi:predicted aspartyl protease